MNQLDFPTWLQEQLNERDWRATDLARRASMSDAAVSRFLRGERRPDVESLQAIAKALRLPIDQVYRAAGNLPPVAGLDETAERIVHEIGDLTAPEKEELLAFIRMKKNLRKRNEHR